MQFLNRGLIKVGTVAGLVGGMFTLLLLPLFPAQVASAGQARAADTTLFSEDFDSFTGAGFAPAPAAGQLDSDVWRVTGVSDGDGVFGGTHTSGDFARGVDLDAATSGGVYAFGADPFIGFQPTGSDFTPGTLTLVVTNTTGSTITDLDVAYDIVVYNDQARSNSLNLAYSTDDSAYTAVSAVDFLTGEAADGSPAYVVTPTATTISGLTWADNTPLYIQWQSADVSGSGSRDQFGVDDVTLSLGDSTPQLLLSEIVVSPTVGEMIEIYNPGSSAVDLSNVYLTDATFAGGSAYYYNLPTGSNAGGGGFGDFHARFPDGASIDPGEYQTISLNGSDDFSTTYGITPTYELYEDGGAADTILDMREAISGTISGQGGLSDGGEIVVLFTWDGSSDLVTDLDYVIWGDTAEAVDKSGISIDGPDVGVTTTTYLSDTATGSHTLISASTHASGSSWSRSDYSEGTEIKSGGNGAGGHNETSENLDTTWCTDGTVTPNAAGCATLAEPTNQPTVFTATANSDVQITNTWVDSVVGSQAAAGYLVMCSTTGFTPPVDGTAQADNTCSDGSGVVNVASGAQTAVWGGLTASTTYSFTIYPYTNSGVNIDYKTDGTILTATATTTAPVVKACDTSTADTCIHEIQGSVDASPLDGNTVTVEGIVTGSYADLDGFFMQEEDSDVDADVSTSEGIFVYTGSDPTVVEGDKVQVIGAVDVFFSSTQLDNDNATLSVTIVSNGNTLPTPASVSLPASGATNAADTFEQYEGMLVTFPDTLTVSEYFELARYGQVILMQGGRQYQYTHSNAPDAAGYAAHQADVLTRRIVLDDGNNIENNAADVFYPQPGGFSATNSFRGGDTVTDMIGVMHWSWAGVSGTNSWRIRPTTTNTVTFTSANPRTAAPTDVGGTLKVATLNVLNFFTTLDTGSSTCGPSNIGCRGANSTAELVRQTAKLTRTLIAMDSDVVGLVEIENNATASLAAVVDALNDALGAGTYDYVNTGTIGTDAIKGGFIYKTATVSLAGSYQILDTAAFMDPNGTGSDKNRPALAQTFEEIASGEKFTAVVNHLKSKGSGCGTGDDDTTTGQGNCNGTRTGAAQAMMDWLATDPTASGDTDFLVLGDLNAYAMEEPITAVKVGADDTANTADDFTNLIERFHGNEAYSFVFSGEWGYLDHALASSSLNNQVTNVTEWHINADEPSLLDYNDKILDPGEPSYEQKPGTATYFSADVYRTSDHDPVIIGLQLGGYTYYLPLIYNN